MELTYGGPSRTIVMADWDGDGPMYMPGDDPKEKTRKVRLMQEAGQLLESYAPANHEWPYWTIDSSDVLRDVWCIGYEWVYGLRAPKMDGITGDLVEACNKDFSEFHEAIADLLSSDPDLPCCVDLDALLESLVNCYLSDETLTHGGLPDSQTVDRFRCIMGLIQLVLMLNINEMMFEAPWMFRYEAVYDPDRPPSLREVIRAGLQTLDGEPDLPPALREARTMGSNGRIHVRREAVVGLLRCWIEGLPEAFAIEDLKMQGFGVGFHRCGNTLEQDQAVESLCQMIDEDFRLG